MQADVEQHLEKMLDCPHANFYSSLASWTSKIFITEKKRLFLLHQSLINDVWVYLFY